jgi:hypothetical protein
MGCAATAKARGRRRSGRRSLRPAEETHEVGENLLLLRVVCLRATIDHFCNDVIPLFGCMLFRDDQLRCMTGGAGAHDQGALRSCGKHARAVVGGSPIAGGPGRLVRTSRARCQYQQSTHSGGGPEPGAEFCAATHPQAPDHGLRVQSQFCPPSSVLRRAGGSMPLARMVPASIC